MKTTNDKKPKELTKTQKEWIHQLDQVLAEHDQRLLKYFDDRMLNLVAQFRGLAIAAKISPENFWKAFTDDKAQDNFYVRLHAQEDLHNQAINEDQDNIKNLKIGFTER